MRCVVTVNNNNNREFVERFRRLKELYNLKPGSNAFLHLVDEQMGDVMNDGQPCPHPNPSNTFFRTRLLGQQAGSVYDELRC